LIGTTGKLDIDPTLGSPREVFSLRCFPPKVKAEDFCDTGFVVDPTTGALTGPPNAACACP
jgi:hypothetical protein